MVGGMAVGQVTASCSLIKPLLLLFLISPFRCLDHLHLLLFSVWLAPDQAAVVWLKILLMGQRYAAVPFTFQFSGLLLVSNWLG